VYDTTVTYRRPERRRRRRRRRRRPEEQLLELPLQVFEALVLAILRRAGFVHGLENVAENFTGALHVNWHDQVSTQAGHKISLSLIGAKKKR
jgi:hypothetical protein